MDNINLPPGVFKNFKLKVELLEVHEGTPPRPATASASGPAGGQLPESRAFDEGTVTCLTRALAEDGNSEERAILCESGARPGVYGLLVKCCAMSLFERS